MSVNNDRKLELRDGISKKFKDAKDNKEVKESDIYPLLVIFLKNKLGKNIMVEKNRPLLLKIYVFLDENKPYLGYSGSDADLILYTPQDAVKINASDNLLRKSGQYSLSKRGIVYPSVIIQIIVNVNTGKLRQENMKAQDWRKTFPHALIVLSVGQHRVEPDIRLIRDTPHFDFVLAGFENPIVCKKNLDALTSIISAHLDAKWMNK